MGKTRKTSKGTSPPVKEIEEPSPEIVQKMRRWQRGGYTSPDKDLTPEELQFIKDNMVGSEDDVEVPTGHLTRVEKAYHFIEKGLKEGDILNTGSVLRAFSREPDATNMFMRDNISVNTPVVIYVTKGNVPHYNVSKHTHEYVPEKESWVETGKLKIDKISHYTDDNYDMKKVMVDTLSLKKYPEELENYYDEIYKKYNIEVAPKDVTVVELSPA